MSEKAKMDKDTPSPLELVMQEELKTVIDSALCKLSPRAELVLRKRYCQTI
jgi:DNA-directed RNA polymerase sigma subunit (sigma70/sigma32)